MVKQRTYSLRFLGMTEKIDAVRKTHQANIYFNGISLFKKIHHIKKLKAGRLFLTQILESKTLQIS